MYAICMNAVWFLRVHKLYIPVRPTYQQTVMGCIHGSELCRVYVSYCDAVLKWKNENCSKAGNSDLRKTRC